MASLFDLYQITPETNVMHRGRPDYGYGNRYNSNLPKQRGYFGEVLRPDGYRSTEISASDDVGEMPLMVPTLNRTELSELLNYMPNRPLAYAPYSQATESVMDNVYKKAREHALMRQMQGLDPFATIQDKTTQLPANRDLYSGLGLPSGAYAPAFSIADLLRR